MSIVKFPFPSLFSKDHQCVCFSRCFRATLPIAEMCKKCAMVGDGDGRWWPAEMVGIPPHLNPRSGDYCHQPIPPLPSVSRWKSVPSSCSARWMATSAPLGPPTWRLSTRDCEQLRLEYPERMPTIRPGKVIGSPGNGGGLPGVISCGGRVPIDQGAKQQGSRVAPLL